jgi:anti-sigma regulatory factor (Ser/Thr protein kinase)
VLIDSATEPLHGVPAGFEHEAFVYTDDEEFVRGAAPFVRAGLEAGEAVLVAVPQARIDPLREELGPSADDVTFIDMAQAGRNPARIIPLWQEVLDEHPGRPVRGIGEPAYVGRTPAELAEAKLHEALLNLAFANAPSFRLRCPYQTAVLDPGLGVGETHPVVLPTPQSPVRVCSTAPTGAGSWAEVAEQTFRSPLPAVPANAEQQRFGAAELSGIRRRVTEWARSYGLSEDRNDDLALALHEMCTNSLRFGGGEGTLTIWHETGTLICDVADHGYITDLLVGRVLAPVTQEGGRGVWLANQLCDLVQVRSTGEATQVRLHLRLE